jgi:hypothetical protein
MRLVYDYATDTDHETSGKLVPISEKKLRRVQMSKNKYTFSFFSNGKSTCSSEQIYHTYAMDLVHDTLSKLTQQVEYAEAEQFPLFVDMDMQVAPVDLGADLESLHRDYFTIVSQCVQRFYPTRCAERPQDLTMIVCGRPMVVKPVDGRPLPTFGFHLHFPHLIVTKEQALYVRQSIIATFCRHFYERAGEDENSWNDVFDRSVYKSPTSDAPPQLRMIGSFKTKSVPRDERCSERRDTLPSRPDVRYTQTVERDGKACAVTYWPMMAIGLDGSLFRPVQDLIDAGFRRCDDGSMYRTPKYAFSREEMLAFGSADKAKVEAVRAVMELTVLTSIRTRRPACGDFTLFDGAPQIGDSDDSRRRITQGIVPERVKGTSPAFKTWPGRASEGAYKLVQDFVRNIRDAETGEPVWPRIEVASLMVNTAVKRKCNTCVVVVRGEGSNFCFNRVHPRTGRPGRDHSSNHIYFWLTEQYISQRCHCDKDNGCECAPDFCGNRHHCRDYDSFRYTARLVNVRPGRDILAFLESASRQHDAKRKQRHEAKSTVPRPGEKRKLSFASLYG